MNYLIDGLFVAIGFALIGFGIEYLNFNLWAMGVGVLIVVLAMRSAYTSLNERYQSTVKTMQSNARTRQWYISTFPLCYANGQMLCSNCNSPAIVEVGLPERTRHYCKKCNHTLYYTPLNQG